MDNSAKQRRVDLWFALAMLVVSLAVLWEAGKLDPAPFDPLGPKSFPVWIASALALVSAGAIVVMLGGRALGRSETTLIVGIGDDAPTDYALRPGLAVAASLLTIAYVAALTFTSAGFLWATIAYVAALGWTMSKRNLRHLVIAAIIAVVAGVTITTLFTKVFIVDLP